jgi:hypothetical protein
MIKNIKKLNGKSTIKEDISKGIKHHPHKLIKNVSHGLKIKIKNSILVGKTISFKIAFKPSAIGCKNPKGYNLLGPLRLCIAAIIFLSANVKKATDSNKGAIVPKYKNKNKSISFNKSYLKKRL